MQKSLHMQEARQLRAQAILYLEVAREVSDHALAESLRQDAAQYIERARELENRRGEDETAAGETGGREETSRSASSVRH